MIFLSEGLKKIALAKMEKQTRQQGTVVNGEIVPDEPETVSDFQLPNGIIMRAEGHLIGDIFPSIFDEPDEPTGWQPKRYIEPRKQDMRIGLLVVAEDLLESRDMWALIEKLQLVTLDIYDTPDGTMIKGHSPFFEQVRDGEPCLEYDVQLIDGELNIKRAE